MEEEIENEDEETKSEGPSIGNPEVSEDEVADNAFSNASSRELGNKVELLQKEAKENFDKYLRSAAELENVKKRAARERSDLLKYGGEGLARDLLDVLDNFERALGVAESSSPESFISGVRMILESFKGTFERHGIRGESSLGAEFDPTKQEALASIPTVEKEPGVVMEEYRKTYYFKDKLLRPGQVVVSSKPAEVESEV